MRILALSILTTMACLVFELLGPLRLHWIMADLVILTVNGSVLAVVRRVA